MDATWVFPTDVPVSAAGYVAAGNTVNLTLNCVPTANELMVIRNTGPAFIQGTFSNLAHGQTVALTFNSITYNFVANYYGGSGNDLVLMRAGTHALAVGANTYGQLGDNTKTQRLSPVAVTSSGLLAGKTILTAAVGGSHSLALCADGTLAAWGYNYDGELGTNSTTQTKVPVLVNTTAGMSALAGKTVVAVAAGELHSLALCADGRVATWGSNYYGQLGDGSTMDSLVPVAVNTAGVLAGKTVTAVAAGQAHTLALCADGTVVAWGYNTDGELGNNSSTDSTLPVAVDRSGPLAGRTVVAVAAGGSHSLALCSDGTLVAWGSNAYGQLGNNTTINSLLPVVVNTASGVSALGGKIVTAIAAGQYHSLALCSDGTVVAWGSNAYGQLGDGTTTQRLVPTAVNSASGSALFGQSVVSVQAGMYHSAALCTDGSIATWGWNGSGQLGDGSTTQRIIPVVVSGTTLAGGERFVSAATGCMASHTLASAAVVPAAVPIIAIEQPVGTGLAHAGTVNFGSWIVGNPVPLTFTIRNKGTSSLTGLTLTKNGTHSADYVITTTPTAPLAAGGITTFTVLFTPAAIGTRTAALQLASNDPTRASFSINLTGTGAATGGVSAVYNAPTDIPVTAASYTATGNTIGFTLNCVPSANELMVINNTGLNFIQGTFSNLAQGQQVSLSYNGITYNLVANYYGGTGNDLVLVWKGMRAFAWGLNNGGQFGDGTTTSNPLPVAVDAGLGSALYRKTILATAAGSDFCLALCSDGTIAAWGDNTYGKLGNNSTTRSLVPVQVNAAAGSALFGKTVVAIAAGATYSLALCSDGTIAAWGDNGSGQLGDGTNSAQRLAPVTVSTGPGSALSGKIVVGIAAGRAHTLARCSDGTLTAWGTDVTGLGNTPVNFNSGMLAGKSVAEIAAGGDHSLALCTDGSLVSWGANAYGQLGDTSTVTRILPVAVDVAAGTSALAGKTVFKLSCGIYHSAALCSDGTAITWGANVHGELGEGTTINRVNPVFVDSTSGISAIGSRIVERVIMGGNYGFALCSDGTLAQWGQLKSPNAGIPGEVSKAALTANERFSQIGSATYASSGYAIVSWPAPPLITTLPASNITPTSATLNASVNANGNAPAVSFEFGTTMSYGTTLTATPAAVTGTSPTAVSAVITGLIPGTVYHFRVKADSIYGDDMTFTAAQSSNSDLAVLSISEGSLSPAFSSATTAYTATVSSQAANIFITPVVADYGTVAVNGTAVTSGRSSSAIALGTGTNVITVTGTSQNGAFTRSYTLTITRLAETNSLTATWNNARDVPLTTSGYTATGSTVNLTLNSLPLANELTIINNLGQDFIQGSFNNLAQGQAVALTHAGQTYNFIANYFGGTGNDLALVWSGTRVLDWGYNSNGQLGDNSTTARKLPVSTLGTVFVGKTVVAIATGSRHSLALCSDNTIVAWGLNSNGQLGDGTTTQRLLPVAVDTAGSALNGKTVVALRAGDAHSLALCSDGTAFAWGDNQYGQLGDGTTTQRLLPVAVKTTAGSALLGKTVTAISAGSAHSLALCSDGTPVAWGYGGDGRLGDDASAQRNAPVAVNMAASSALFGKTVVSIGGGAHFSMALCADGSVATWGNNSYGQIGDGTSSTRLIPVTVNRAEGSALFGKAAVAIVAGYTHVLALCSDGSVVAWGDNQYGQLGDTTTTLRLSPVTVNRTGSSALAGKTIVALSASTNHCLALCSDGSVASWGYNGLGQLGDNTLVARAVPVAVNSASFTSAERFTRVAGGSNNSHSLALVSSSVPPPPPTCTTSAIANLTLTGVQLNGSVNAQGYNTTVSFEYGITGTTFPSSINVTPLGLNGSSDVAVTTTLTGLTKGTTYYYRLKGENQGGTTYSATQSFITRTEPTAAVVNATAQSTTSSLVTGTLNAHGSDTQVFFDYGTDVANLSNSIQASPSIVTGYTDTSVSVVLTNLAQATTYYYRIRGSSVAGVGTSTTASFQLASLSGLIQTFPSAAPEAQGFVFVTLTPASILSGWRFVGEQLWRASGVPVGGLTTGTREIEFRPVPGYIQPPQETVSITSGAAASLLTLDYYETATTGSGGITVTLKPSAITTGTGRAQWRLLGEDDAHWRDSGATLTGLIPGSYSVECKPVTGHATPPHLTALVENSQTSVPTITYFLADAQTGTPPTALAFETLSDPTKPYAYVGQIRSNAGSSTGFVVKPRVVATAGHVVWDDGTLSAAQNLQWLFQRDRSTYEPKSQISRGFYIYDGYAAQRVIDNSPGDSSPESQHLDVAAMYFNEDAGRGGSGGFLASDLDDNEFLLSNANKMLVGYPVDGIAASSQGRMHATPPANVVFNAAYGRTFTTSGIRSSGGNSGGPLCVQYQGGNYYPAAIYLGGNAQTVVRAIDSTVIELFNRAAVSGSGGGNNTGGGITHTSVSTFGSAANPGAIKVLIEPAGARNAGAGWRLSPETSYRLSAAQKSGLNAGSYVLQLNTVAGYQAPTAQNVTVTGGQLYAHTFTYALALSAQESWRAANFGSTANTGNAADSFDFDGDGFTNAQEYAAGSNPTLSGDFFKANNPQRSASTFSVNTPGKAGRSYVLECSTTMAAGSWTTVDTEGPLASDQAVTLTDAASPPGVAFYQIRVTGP